MTRTLTTWANANFPWNNNRFTWNDVFLLQRAAGDLINEPWQKWEENDKKKLIKLILKIHGNTITEQKQKEIKQYKIKVSDIKIAINKISNVEIVTENVKF